MQNRNRWLVAVLILAALPLAACEVESEDEDHEEPAHVEHDEGSELGRVTLTERAIQRLDVKTAPVRAMEGTSVARRTVVPYSSVIYDAYGGTWVYISPAPRTYIRQPIDIDYIEGDLAVLTGGPAPGTEVVTVGAAELYGTEFEVGH